jgi:hypothetical protein
MAEKNENGLEEVLANHFTLKELLERTHTDVERKMLESVPNLERSMTICQDLEDTCSMLLAI